MKFLRARLIFIIIFGALFPFRLFAYEESQAWQTTETKFCTLVYQGDVDLKQTNKKLRVNNIEITYYKFIKDSSVPLEALKNKLDLIFMKTEEILDMYPAQLRVRVKILKNLRDLHAEYERIFGLSTDIVSFYVFKTNIVCLCEESISEGVVAHEFAHAIIDHYFDILPPPKVQEMLATYVDLHLKD